MILRDMFFCDGLLVTGSMYFLGITEALSRNIDFDNLGWNI